MNRLLTKAWIQITLLLILLCVFTVNSFSHARWREQIRNFTFDSYNILKPREASKQIVVVDLDEASQQAIGQWPWPRTIIGDLVTKLEEYGASVVAFDMVFPEPDRHSPDQISYIFEAHEGFEDMSARMEDLPGNDKLFGQAIKEAKNVITGFSFTNDETPASPRQKGIFRGKNVQNYVPNLSGASANQKAITKYAAGNGSFFVSSDTDGIIRRVPMLVAHNKPNSKITSVYPSLSLETLRVYKGERGGSVVLGDPRYAELDPARFGIKGIEIGRGETAQFVPTNARGEFLVYFSQFQRDLYVPAYQVLDGTADPARIKDKIVLIGTSAVGLKDIRSTPLNPFIPGVDVHMNIIDQVLQGQYLTRSFEAEGLEAVALFSLGLAVIVTAPFVGAVAQAFFMLCLITAALSLGWFSFVEYGLLIDVTYPILSLILVFMLSTILTYIRSEAERKQVRDAFGLYISPDFMKELTSDPDKLKLGGENRDLTVMFSDIRSFTTICEGLKPEEIIELMNDFLTPMTDLVMENRGTIDKYMGDAMMAFWNAPLDDENHARHACETALKMNDALVPVNEEVKRKAAEIGKEPVLLNAGIGINTGPCAVGNMGSRQRFAYSTLGDAVNLASRLEGQTKSYGVNILIGEETSKAIPDYAVLEFDLLQVKGKTKPVRVFHLFGGADIAKTEEFINLKTYNEQMIEKYRTQKFKESMEICEEGKKLFGGQLAFYFDLYTERNKAMILMPPGEDWNGVYVATSK